MFLGKTLYSHKCLSTPGSINRYRQIAREEIKKCLGVNLGMDWHPIQEREGEVQILLVASRHRNLPAELATCLKYRLNLLPQTIYCILEIVSDTKSQVNIKESCNDLGRGPVIAIKINFAFSLYKNSEHFTWIHPGSEFGFTFTW